MQNYVQDGRISMAGISSSNVGYLAHAMHTVTKQVDFHKYITFFVFTERVFLLFHLKYLREFQTSDYKSAKSFNIIR